MSYGRPRDSQATGVAVPRSAPPRPGGPVGPGGPIYVYPPYGYYPWGWGGYGFGGYYGWGYYGFDGYRDYTVGYIGDGQLKLKIKPKQAQAFVDGYYAGEVDDFDGLFQSLHIEPGPHDIEIRAEGYESLFFGVRISSGRTITFSGDMKRE